ncbi:hypothetical protein [Gandjariella thermophila]|uniref:Uncharacterized protein n=1 Tax=Gandjariella thermophila TaxID=1931992 RepID=A0A4D4JE67_9PSEU|nr:hypothetical protein [Gandjariella thermophila]GDY32666.1 hypothetical protein GTS_42990 [Gandjariella thermophila]
MSAYRGRTPPMAGSGDFCRGLRQYGPSWHRGGWWRAGFLGRCFWSDTTAGWFWQSGFWKFGWSRDWVWGTSHYPDW